MADPDHGHRSIGLRYRALVLVASFLLFQIELIVGRMLLPPFGSAASVWMTCLMFFQGALLAGYAFAAVATRRIAEGSYRWAHLVIVLVPLIAFPFRVRTFALPPALAVVIALALSVGLAFVVLSTTSVLAQAWFARTQHPDARNPWFLYGTSNLGALLGLLTYPLVLEPLFELSTQLLLWYAGYALFVGLSAAAVVAVPGGSRSAPASAPVTQLPAAQLSDPSDADGGAQPGPSPTTPSESGSPGEPSSPRRTDPEAPQPGVASWLLFPAAANALLMAGTQAVTLDASVPLLWVIPLALYLVTLIICFARTPPSRRAVNGMAIGALVVALASLVLLRQQSTLQYAYVALHGIVLFVGCLLLHSNLVATRPADVGRLGTYYLCISLGGWAGSVTIGLGVPWLFRSVALPYVEYAVAGALAIAAFLARDAGRIVGSARTAPVLFATRVMFAVFVLLAVAIVAVRSQRSADTVDGSRTFYGLYRVKDQDGRRWFHHGNTVHGVEALDPEGRGHPLAYYSVSSPVAALLETTSPRTRIAVVGLGVGSLAAYGRAGESWDFYELDPEVERIAREHFTFLRHASSSVRVVVGDARLTLADAPDGAYDVLVLDAFSSDFVPTHLLTREAVELYRRKVRPGGVVVCHISNRIFDLTPVLARVAEETGMFAAYKESGRADARGAAGGVYESRWFALTSDPATHQRIVDGLRWRVPEKALTQGRRAWSDEYVNLFHALR